MAVTITNPKKDMSAKYQIFLTATSDNPFLELVISRTNGNAGDLAYTTIAEPFALIAGLYQYKLDIASILDTIIPYVPLTFFDSLGARAMGQRAYFQDNVSVVLNELDGGLGSDFWSTKFYKIRKPFYQYWKETTESVFGVNFTLPASIDYPLSLTTYRDNDSASMLQGYTVGLARDVDVTWIIDGGPPVMETIAFASVITRNVLQLGLDEMINVSSAVTIVDRPHILSYTVDVVGVDPEFEITVAGLEHCKFKPLSLSYVDSNGLWSSLSLPASWREILTSRKTMYRRSPQLIPGGVGGVDFVHSNEMVTPTFGYDYKRRFNIITNWITETEMEQFRFASTSDQVFSKFVVPGEGPLSAYVVPVNILNAEVLIKQRHKDKMYSLNIELEEQVLNK